MGIKSFLLNRMVKSRWGFSPGAKVARGATVFDISLRVMAAILIKHARRLGPIDEERIVLLERVHGHFSEHVLYTELPIESVLAEFHDMNNRYDIVGQHRFEREAEEFIGEVAPKLPRIVRNLLLTHLAMLQRVDIRPLSNDERSATIRDEHGLLFANVTSGDVEEILNEAAAYKIESRQHS